MRADSERLGVSVSGPLTFIRSRFASLSFITSVASRSPSIGLGFGLSPPLLSLLTVLGAGQRHYAGFILAFFLCILLFSESSDSCVCLVGVSPARVKSYGSPPPGPSDDSIQLE